jgi:O-antigen/teichoic acid export membrane protein
MNDLKERTIRGGSARICSQGVSFLIRVGSLVVLARLLEPKDFGLVGMVTAFTGVLSLFRDFGLSAATVQRANVTEEQTSSLFWINVATGLVLGLATVCLAPAISSFYHEPRLVWIASVIAAAFVFNGAGVQHSAMLQRQMRFTALSLIDTGSLIVSSGVAFGVAIAGYGYWALVSMAVCLPLVTTLGLWLVSGWVPGRPHRQAGLRSMMRFGGLMTLNGLIVYVASNFDKVLLGRFWGAEAIGLYGRAYQLIRIPIDNLNGAVGEVAFAALSRVQNDPDRLKRYFLKGYALVLAVTMPITVACAIFAEELIIVLLGPKWREVAGIFRFLSPTILAFAIVNPLGWLLNSTGQVGRCLKIALVFTPVVIVGYFIGLPYGPIGVASAYSLVTTLSIVPMIAWCVRGSVISFWDVALVIVRPLIAIIVAASLALGVRFFYGLTLSPVPRLLLENAVLLLTYGGVLFFVVGEKALYLDLLRSLKGSPPAEAKKDEKPLATVDVSL